MHRPSLREALLEILLSGNSKLCQADQPLNLRSTRLIPAQHEKTVGSGSTWIYNTSQVSAPEVTAVSIVLSQPCYWIPEAAFAMTSLVIRERCITFHRRALNLISQAHQSYARASRKCLWLPHHHKVEKLLDETWLIRVHLSWMSQMRAKKAFLIGCF